MLQKSLLQMFLCRAMFLRLVTVQGLRAGKGRPGLRADRPGEVPAARPPAALRRRVQSQVGPVPAMGQG